MKGNEEERGWLVSHLAAYCTPPGRENGEAQNENSELFFQPIPGMGLLYTGWSVGGSKTLYLYSGTQSCVIPSCVVKRGNTGIHNELKDLDCA